MTRPIRTIVAGVSEIVPAEPVHRYALELAERLDATLHLVHAVLPPTDWGLGMDAAVGLATTPGFTTGAETLEVSRILAGRLEELIPESARRERTHARAVMGPADLALADTALEVGADLLLVGAGHHGRIERMFLGTTAGRTLRTARAPVLVLRTPPRHPGTRVLLTTDLSAVSAKALERGIETLRALFPREAAEYRCLYTETGTPGDLPAVEADELRAAASTTLRRFLVSLGEQAARIEGVARIGAPLDEIVAEASEWPADLVVLGTHGRSGLSRLVLGSVAEAAVRDLPCSALVIPLEGENETRTDDPAGGAN